VPVLRKDGTPKTTKTGREITRRLTVEDKDQPLPNRKCDKCSIEIQVGQPYKWVQPKSGPYGGSKRFRCGPCPSWQPWELSQSLSARLQQVSYDAQNGVDREDASSVADALRTAAEAVREISEEKKESADNIRDGFGNDNPVADELEEVGDQLSDWADELESAADEVESLEVPEEDVDCPNDCDNGQVENPEYEEGGEEPEFIDCDECAGDGTVPNEEELEEFHGQLDEFLSKLDESPI
jgi:hypothetical protein